jgi:hypothetical protein
MKKFIFFAHVHAWLLLSFPQPLQAQDSLTTYPNYVVIGAFAFRENAVQFTDDANKNNFPAKFEINPNRNLYYVYVLSTDDRPFAFAEALKLRTDTKYFDTWVYSGILGETGLATGVSTQSGDLNPETGSRLQNVDSESNQLRSAAGPTPGLDGGVIDPSDPLQVNDPSTTVQLASAEDEKRSSRSGRKGKRDQNSALTSNLTGGPNPAETKDGTSTGDAVQTSNDAAQGEGSQEQRTTNATDPSNQLVTGETGQTGDQPSGKKSKQARSKKRGTANAALAEATQQTTDGTALTPSGTTTNGAGDQSQAQGTNMETGEVSGQTIAKDAQGTESKNGQATSLNTLQTGLSAAQPSNEGSGQNGAVLAQDSQENGRQSSAQPSGLNPEVNTETGQNGNESTAGETLTAANQQTGKTTGQTKKRKS